MTYDRLKKREKEHKPQLQTEIGDVSNRQSGNLCPSQRQFNAWESLELDALNLMSDINIQVNPVNSSQEILAIAGDMYTIEKC